MAEMKNYDSSSDKNDLKKVDSQRRSKLDPISNPSSLIGGKKINEAISRRTKKKKLPIALDIVIGIVLVAVLLSVVVGAYMLFRYYSNDYDVANIEYTVVSTVNGDIASYASLEDKSVYYNIWGNSLYFGKVKDVEIIVTPDETDKDTVVITVSAEVKHREGEGYKIGDYFIAIGQEYDLMIGDKNITKAAVVEVSDKTGGQ